MEKVLIKHEPSILDFPPSSLDFRSLDDAWYTVRLALKEETLIVKYCDFTDAFDQEFYAVNYKDPKELEDFAKRFRPTAVQLQDSECRNVVGGMAVCASYIYGIDDVKFYDAVVTKKDMKDHKFQDNEECTCIFELFWLNGPNAGTVTNTSVANICILQTGNVELDPTLSAFLQVCRVKYACCVSKGAIVSSSPIEAVKSITDSKLWPPNCEMHTRSIMDIYKHSVSPVRNFKDRSSDHVERESTSASNFHLIWIENLENDLSPLTIVDFVIKNLSITAQAQVFPSSSLESYTRGNTMVDNRE